MDHHQHKSSRVPEHQPAVRTRWTPKPEQVLILESIFAGGMVNPRKDETVKIRMLLEQFGPVGDANIFYWFQNRRSRARRRLRQLQQAAAATAQPLVIPAPAAPPAAAGGGVNYDPYEPTPPPPSDNNLYPYCYDPRPDSADDLFSITRQMGISTESPPPPLPPPPPPSACSSDLSHLHHQSAGSGSSVVVFIDGVLSEVPRGPIDLGSAFGQDAMLLHSSGELLPVDEHGVLTRGLQMGESYFLVSKPPN